MTLRAAACLSLTGRFAPFGRQAEQGLRLWADDVGVDLTVTDDQSDPAVLTDRLAELTPGADLLFGPYSTILTRAAIAVAEDHDALLFNHGGSGGTLDRPGRVVNILTPANRYAEPFVAHLAAHGDTRLFTVRGRGAFGRDITAGAQDTARAIGTAEITVAELDFDAPPAGAWSLLSAGVYEDDIAAVRRALALSNPPQRICSVAAGVAAFADDLGADPDGVYGIGQWAPGEPEPADIGMGEAELLAAWHGCVPDYPGVQAYAAGVIAETAAHAAGTTAPQALWRAVAVLDATTVFGRFRIDPATGTQDGHRSVLTRWSSGKQARVQA